MVLNKDHSLIKALLGSIFHTTSVDSYKKIHEDGYIRPNLGQFSYTHGQSQYSCVSRLKGISLFDFGISEDEIFFMEGPLPWENVIVAHEPVSVIIDLKRNYLEEKLLTWEETKERAGDPPCMLVPYVEVCYPEPISLDAVRRLILVHSQKSELFKIIDGQNLASEHLHSIYT